MQTLIKNATVIDGTGAEAVTADVAVEDGRIAAIEPGISAIEATEVVDAKGLVLSPGFIDAHSHSDISILAAPDAKGKISQGITTEIIGNCGLSVFPLTDKNRDHLQELYQNYDQQLTWDDLDGYAEELDKRQPATNIASLCGHNSLRGSVLGYKDKEITSQNFAEMRELLRGSLSAGAAGMSTGDRKSTRLNSSHIPLSRMLPSA